MDFVDRLARLDTMSQRLQRHMKEFTTKNEANEEANDFYKSNKGLYGGGTHERRTHGKPPQLAHRFILDPYGDEAALEQWHAFVGQDMPLEFEIGFGPGAFMASRSAANPDRLFLAFEVRTKQCAELLERVEAKSQTNVRVIQTDARPVLRDFINTGRISDIHVNFPDPWWKKRHHKRRIFSPGFIEVAREKLQVGGSAWLRTDVRAYAEHVQELFSTEEDFKTETFAADTLDWTHRERKCTLYGLPVARLRFTKLV